ncbi:MAG TPA: D-alanyl-D-alanine carboxypeptidase [Ferruginibacter sp.]|nr:D-alanyl-D-alanine carboxypeptidase [Ferruginibacter sp.]HRO17595.1 D-alanyl-D-alanine carboxypeptidase [Ferruginibacter sp.]HRQ19741.1 D-alanyl-D-alanine carboxypeptidase [Ferruginibacter sp.]
MRSILPALFICWSVSLYAQSDKKLESAIQQLYQDDQFKHAVIGLSVWDVQQNRYLFNHGGLYGLTPASALKVLTSISGYELLGQDFTYSTSIEMAKDVKGRHILRINGSGDPAFGSHRWSATQAPLMLERIGRMLNEKKIQSLHAVYINDMEFGYQPVPKGWVWEDIGNYYGAGAWGFNWRENHFKLTLKPALKQGDPAAIIATDPLWLKEHITNFVTTGEKGTGDQTSIYSSPYQTRLFIQGTIGMGVEQAVISGAMPDPAEAFGFELQHYFSANNIHVDTFYRYSALRRSGAAVPSYSFTLTDTIQSPVYAAMDYWFLQKSINAFGESFVKTIGWVKGAGACTPCGIEVIREFWMNRGISSGAIQIIDGSGLSPNNKISTQTLVEAINFARTRPWFNRFYSNLPVMNGIRMKSGYISGVRSYAGIVKSLPGKEYVFAFIVNNFDGNPSSVREKMWKVLDILKVQ